MGLQEYIDRYDDLCKRLREGENITGNDFRELEAEVDKYRQEHIDDEEVKTTLTPWNPFWEGLTKMAMMK